MADILRYRVTLKGLPGGDGVATFHSLGSDGLAFATDVRAFLEGAFGTGGPGHLPTGVSLSYANLTESIDIASGDMTGQVAFTAPATTVGANPERWAAPAGACVTWLTSGFANGRRVKGRTFLVPLSSVAFQSDGSIDETRRTAINSAAATFAAAASNPCVYRRPVPGGGGGAAYAIDAGTCRDRVAILTSRRS